MANNQQNDPGVNYLYKNGFFSFLKKKTKITQVGKFKDNSDDKKRDIFLKYINNNILNRLRSTWVNLQNLLLKSWDSDNPIESK